MAIRVGMVDAQALVPGVVLRQPADLADAALCLVHGVVLGQPDAIVPTHLSVSVAGLAFIPQFARIFTGVVFSFGLLLVADSACFHNSRERCLEGAVRPLRYHLRFVLGKPAFIAL